MNATAIEKSIVLTSFTGDTVRGKVIAPCRPLRVLILTSIRDVGVCDQNGRDVFVDGEKKYMEGATEYLLRISNTGPVTERNLEIVGIVIDDFRPQDTEVHGWSHRYDPNSPWIAGKLCGHHYRGVPLKEMIYYIPSLFRALPINDTKDRQREKKKFEQQIARLGWELGADVVLSDHYMAKIEHLIHDPEWIGRVLNIHPAVTPRDHPCCLRGKTPTADAITRAHDLGRFTTGATFHVVNDEIDDGPPIAYSACTPVYPDMTPETLRWHNYQLAKLPVLERGLEHYRTEIYPYIVAGVRPTHQNLAHRTTLD